MMFHIKNKHNYAVHCVVFGLMTLSLVNPVQNFMEEEIHKITYLEGKIGQYAIFNCHIDFPQDVEIPYTLHWMKDVRNKCVLERRHECVDNVIFFLYTGKSNIFMV